MADDKDQIISDLNDNLDLLKDKLNNISATLTDRLINKLSDAASESDKLVASFAKGEDVTKKAAQQLSNLIKENNKLSFNRIKLESDLSKSISAGNANAERRIRTALLQNQLALEQLDNTAQITKQILAAAEAEAKIAAEKKKQNSLSGVANKLYEDNFKKTVESFTTVKGIIDILISSILNFNKISVEVGKNFGYGADNANRLTDNLKNAAQNSENINFTLANAAEAMNQLNEQTGFVAEYSAKTLETQIMLTKQFGLTGEEAAGIYKYSVLTGKSAEEVNKSMVKAYVSARNQLNVGIPFKATMAEAAKISGQLAANLKNNPELIVKAVAQAKALGVTLEQTKKQGESLLDFESSIESELKAELLTGQSLNLERARAAALMGDQVTVMKELANQGMTFEKFQSMNVLAQKSFAAALGLSSDELANQLRQQKLAVESGKSLAQITEEEALEAEKRQNIQDKFNAAVLKLQDFIGNLVAGPMAGFIDILTQALDIVYLIIAPFKLIYDMASMIGNTIGGLLDKLGALGKVLKGIAGLAIIFAAYSAYASLAAIPIVGSIAGAIAAASITAAGFGLLNSTKADDMTSDGYGKRTIMSPEGTIRLNDNDTVIAGTNLNRGGTDNSALIAAINKQTEVISNKNYNPTLQTVIGGSVVATAAAQNSYSLA